MFRALLLLFLTLPLLGMESTTRVMMGTFITLSLPDGHDAERERAFLIMEGVDRRFSTYKPDSEISRLNRGEGLIPSSAMQEMLGYATSLYRLTEGVFDPTVGGYTKSAYAFGTEKESLPDDATLSRLAERVGLDELDTQAVPLRLPEGMQLDFGGIAKGYAVQKAGEYLIKAGITRGQIAASGDILCLDRCEVRITHPKDETRDFARFRTRFPMTSVSTSGTYRRYIGDTAHHHLLDPKSGRSQSHALSVTLLARHANTFLDALATAVSIMPSKKAIALLESLPDVGWFIIYPDLTHARSPNFHRFAGSVDLNP